MRPKIIIDVDGVLSNTHLPWLNLYNAEWDDNLQIKDITKWEMHELVKPECGKLIYEYLKDPILYQQSPIIHGAKEGVEFLKEFGEVYFVTSGLFTSKFEWLYDFGFIPDNDDWRFINNIIVTSDKSMISGDVIIDDYAKNLIGDRKLKLLFDRPWNQRPVAHDVTRVHGWDEITKIISWGPAWEEILRNLPT